ncbi:MAG: twin-arginine translocase TatA/TatE family subunit [Flavobacteriaceae bacterium]|nr:twin-arginine translocase TatA/TatE family subunit [Flavobacteriaceae bacterium]
MYTLNIFLGMVGAPQVIVILVAVLLLFGGKKIPELMKGLGQGMKEFKNATKDIEKTQEKISE